MDLQLMRIGKAIYSRQAEETRTTSVEISSTPTEMLCEEIVMGGKGRRKAHWNSFGVLIFIELFQIDLLIK